MCPLELASSLSASKHFSDRSLICRMSASFRENPPPQMEHGKGFRLVLGLKGQERAMCRSISYRLIALCPHLSRQGYFLRPVLEHLAFFAAQGLSAPASSGAFRFCLRSTCCVACSTSLAACIGRRSDRLLIVFERVLVRARADEEDDRGFLVAGRTAVAT